MNVEEQALFSTYTTELKLNAEIANTLARDVELSRFYNEALSIFKSPITLANIIANEVARELKQTSELTFSAKEVAELAKMIDEGVISNKIAKQVFEEMAQTGEATKIYC